MELEGLTEAEAKLKQYIFAAQDKMATDNLQIDLMEAMGDISAATTARRRLELRGMSAADQQLKIRIWRLQDEKELLAKHNEQQITILELLGKKSEALALSRQLELETMDAQLRPAQQYIWALQDEQKLKDELQEAYDKQKDTLKSTVSTLKDASRALKDYKAELLQSELSVLNPQQKYAEAKQQALNLAAIATSVATTETQRLEKESAISKLPGATSAWLEASRTLYASSEAYTNDFNMVLSILDQTSAALDAQQTDAEKQLTQLETSNSYLSELKDSSRSVETILKELVIATNKVAEAKAAVPAGTPTVSSPFAVATTGASGTLQDASWVGSKGLKTTSKEIAATINSMVNSDPYGLYNKYVSEGFSSQMVDSIMGYAPGTALDWAKTLGPPRQKLIRP
jgi:chromosome segregation ATPase